LTDVVVLPFREGGVHLLGMAVLTHRNIQALDFRHVKHGLERIGHRFDEQFLLALMLVNSRNQIHEFVTEQIIGKNIVVKRPYKQRFSAQISVPALL
jgi:hypothetical protein